MIARASSILRKVAPSISLTSSELPLRISTHAAHSPHGSAVGPFSQFRQRARIRAAVVLPTPRIPVNKNACAIRPRLSASPSVRVTCSWPTSSEKRSGRHLRASTRCGVWESAIAKIFSRDCPSNDSQAPLRHRVAAGTVASFRTWRGSRPSLAQDPAISGGQSRKLLQRVFLLRALLQYHSGVLATADDEFVSCPL